MNIDDEPGRMHQIYMEHLTDEITESTRATYLPLDAMHVRADMGDVEPNVQHAPGIVL
jgi:hypothetical protein